MIFSVKLDPKVAKFIDKLSEDISERIKSKLRLLKDEPFRYLKHFSGKEVYKFRIGEYRALVDVDFIRRVIFARVFDHRKKVYKK